MATMTIGTKVYYKGDMANCDGFGEVLAIRPATRLGDLSYDLVMEDGRTMLGISPLNFGGNVTNKSYRFMTRAAYDMERAQVMERYAEVARNARKGVE